MVHFYLAHDKYKYSQKLYHARKQMHQRLPLWSDEIIICTLHKETCRNNFAGHGGSLRWHAVGRRARIGWGKLSCQFVSQACHGHFCLSRSLKLKSSCLFFVVGVLSRCLFLFVCLFLAFKLCESCMSSPSVLSRCLVLSACLFLPYVLLVVSDSICVLYLKW